jgi:hypothetical protein
VATTGAGERFAQREVHGIDDAGAAETITFWIDWLPGGLWGVGRAVNLANRENPQIAREDDWVFRGYELDDALAAANDALAADLDVSREDGSGEKVEPFDADDLRRRLEHWFFHHG